MKPIDFVLILIILSVVGIVIYFGFIKNKGDVCRSCPYSGKKNCHCKTKENESKFSKNEQSQIVKTNDMSDSNDEINSNINNKNDKNN